MKKHALAIPVLLLAAVLVSGCTTAFDGSPPKVDQGRLDAVTASATAWLAGPMGSERFPGGTLATPIAALNDNDSSINHWILPVKDGTGMYLGFFNAVNDDFTVPSNDIMYPEPRHNLFSMSKDDAYAEMLAGSKYLSHQVKEPYLAVLEGKGYIWKSNVVVDGQKAGTLYHTISIIDPSPADNRLISSV